MNKQKLSDPGSERALIGTIIKNGKNAFIDTEGILEPTDFSIPINKVIFSSIVQLCNDSNDPSIDIESIKLKARNLGFTDFFSQKKDIEYLELLESNSFNKDNIKLFALQIKKFAICRDLYNRYSDAINYLDNITGNETLSDIVREAEGRIIDFINGVDRGNGLEQLSSNIEQYVQEVLDREEVDQPGLPTGFPIFDDAIGGGLRRGTVTVKGARPKCGKSFDALNVGLNTSKIGIPTLYLDSELTRDYQKNRMICINSGCPLVQFETGKFRHDKELVKNVTESSKQISTIPFFYESISGMEYSQVLSLVRQWIVKYVGFNNQGKANDCLVIYDYLKLTTSNSLTKVTPEYIVLGLMLTEMHNFCVKYDIPIMAYVQLNREGIDGEDTDIVAGSDRILWLCSSLSILRNKNENDISMGCGFEHGNKLLKVLETRHGAGLDFGDYINLKCDLRPNVDKNKASGLIREGLLYSQVRSMPTNNEYKNQSRNPEPNQGSSTR